MMTPLRLSLLFSLALGLSMPLVATGCSDDGGGRGDDDDDMSGDDDDDMSGDDDDDDDDMDMDAGPQECPFSVDVDSCRLLEDGACEAGEACYWLIQLDLCDPDADDCADGFECSLNERFGEFICQDGSEIVPAGTCDMPRTNGAPGDPCGLGLYEPGDGRLEDAFRDCQDGSTCDLPTRQCASYCCQEADCSEDQFCFVNQGRGVGVCRNCQGCELTPNAGCNDGDGCYLVSGCATCLAAPTDPVAENDPCNFADDCAPGRVCTSVGGGAQTCRRLCRTDADLCDDGDRCQNGIFDDDPQLGICVPDAS